MPSLWNLFLMFLKINLLTTSGPASVGLLYEETVGKLLSEEQFIEAVGFSNVLPGSDALQLAMFVGYAAAGMPGALVAVAGSILPPTILMVLVVSVLQTLSGEAWLSRFVRGLTPAVAILMVSVAWKVFKESGQILHPVTVGIAVAALAAIVLKAPAPLVLLGAGVAGILLYR